MTDAALPPLPSLVKGGPCHAAMRAAGLLGRDDLPRGGAAFTLGGVAWTIGALLALAEWLATGEAARLGWFLDAVPPANALVALPVLIATERSTDGRLGALLAFPIRQGLVGGTAETRYRADVARADRLSSSGWVEALLLVAAAAICLAFAADNRDADGWSRTDGALGLSWAGLWLYVGVGALLVFLALRWLLRFALWTLLLARLASLPLDLVPTHGDRAGGLGFVTAYPTLFDGFVLGASAAVGATLLNAVLHGGASAEDVARASAVWLAVVVAVFVGPLLLFWPRLARLREQALLEFGERVGRENRRLLGLDVDGEAVDVQRANTLNSLYDRAAGIQPVLVTRPIVVQVVTVAIVPLLPAIVVHVPSTKLVSLVFGGLP